MYAFYNNDWSLGVCLNDDSVSNSNTLLTPVTLMECHWTKGYAIVVIYGTFASFVGRNDSLRAVVEVITLLGYITTYIRVFTNYHHTLLPKVFATNFPIPKHVFIIHCLVCLVHPCISSALCMKLNVLFFKLMNFLNISAKRKQLSLETFYVRFGLETLISTL